mmetsp:Transcript_13262/g.21710  ORF Transcript_13262/g.21710 Transcript_13262/m.21710 type:complete len:379 (+) Transcript_13262:90-1226(+)|eukprot:CAMPEP_0114459442 /NCGR_PEP_ID=MMETSP0104-20121206/5210_1 /TAXON_ID=37642 ORGANISM="Paraphysomonas imperforata, Strain PA2" /NCGR_SAMPLE_ID=MMETSP0104 /ASSEMBLY_ACC=CAM_ASM_000202 /LENGTH=378 /DNA_ID=CAMNT_0001632079 /DNA_START=23 /DNA_END=1159 /DNA_ORIENTATION=-
MSALRDIKLQHVIVVVAKIPSKGVSKSRLIPSLGEEATLTVAEALLLDTIGVVSRVEGNQHRILYFAPSHAAEHAYKMLSMACAESDSLDSWELLPMPEVTKLSSHKLTALLAHALAHVAHRGALSCTFVGSDTPDLPAHEILIGQCIAATACSGSSCGGVGIEGKGEVGETEEESKVETSREGHCYLCPAEDGGYVLLSLPLLSPRAHSRLAPPSNSACKLDYEQCTSIFIDVEWSSPLTLSSQVDSLETFGWKVHVGAAEYRDMDEREDLSSLLQVADRYMSEEECLALRAGGIAAVCQQLAIGLLSPPYDGNVGRGGGSDGGSDGGKGGDSGSDGGRGGGNDGGKGGGICAIYASFRYTSPPVRTLAALELLKSR